MSFDGESETLLAIGEPRGWTVHSTLEPEPGDLWGTPTRVYLVVSDARLLAKRFQTDVHGLPRWRVSVVPVDRHAIGDRSVFETFPCKTDGTRR